MTASAGSRRGLETPSKGLAETLEEASQQQGRRIALPYVEGKHLAIGGQRFFAKGVTYGTFAPNVDGEPFPQIDELRQDFRRMRESGFNTVRIYSPPSDRIADAAADAGLYLIPDIAWGPRVCFLEYPHLEQAILDDARSHARRLSGHPGILAFSVGNEIPPLIARWHGRVRIESFIRKLYDTVKEQAPDNLVTYVNHPPTEYLHLPFLDFVSYNIYLEREAEFRSYLARLHMLAGAKPVMLAELGLDSLQSGEAAQAESLEWQLKASIELGMCGATVYSWTDAWSIFGTTIEGWAFGLTDARRQAKPALNTVSRILESDRYLLRQAEWPRVSVVVCSYNGGATIGETLQSLAQLTYPDYEVIVIDDGSTDGTSEIARHFDVRLISVPNGGLGRARNLGIENATGEIVAFIDSDAYADPDWLYYIVTTMERNGAVAAGGPNLSPPADGFVAQCVDHAPGNPTHVLVDDEIAEHVPGCNMAFRVDAIRAIGAFDATHRAAGDDVDVCWKLLVREQKIAFSPCAVVWHHRRPTMRSYLRQQKGYGKAEAHLQRRYPGRFNIFGDLVWAGSIYDMPHASLREYGVPALFRPKVYQGYFCGAPFQSIYQPFLTWWFQVFTTGEWQLLSWLVLLSGTLGVSTGHVSAAVLSGLGVVMFLASLASALLSGLHGSRSAGWRAGRRAYGALVVGLCHLLQPLWRGAGFLRGLLETRGAAGSTTKSVQRFYGNLWQRELWLERIPKHLKDCGWVCVACGEWEDADLLVTGPGPFRARITTAYEDDNQRGDHYIRCRVKAEAKSIVPLAWIGILGVVPLIALYWFLLPMLIPVAFVAWRLASARRGIEVAVMQVAAECGEQLGITPVPVEFQ